MVRLVNTIIRTVTRNSGFKARLFSSTAMKMDQAKIEPEKMKLIITPELEKLVSYFDKYGHEIRIAGGAVRDLLSGEKIPNDIDLATTATPQEMLDMFAQESVRTINETGLKHGTVTARIDEKANFEVTTLRIDKVTDGRHAEVEFTTDWKLDAERRDLTINSMFLGMDGTVIDFFNGREDLKRKRIAFVGNADSRIKEDYLRILRYFRFYGRLAEHENSHEEATLRVIRENAEGLARISGERIWSEWKKILQGRMGGRLTLRMIDLGLSPFIGLPDNPNCDELENVLVTKSELPLQPMTLMTQLLRNQDEATKLNLRLRMSAYERDLAIFLIEHRNIPQDLKHWQRTLLTTKQKQNSVREWIEEAIMCYSTNVDLLQQFKSWEVPKFPISGQDLKNEGVPAGKPIGHCMNLLKEHWIESDFKHDKSHLLQVELPKIVDTLLNKK